MKIQHGFTKKEPMHSLFLSHGVEAVHIPFLEHQGLDVTEPTKVPEVVLISSARTIQYWGVWGQWIRTYKIPVLAISTKTQVALQNEGIPSLCSRGTGDQLVKMLDEVNCSSFVHIGAAELSSRLASALRVQHRVYDRIPVYKSWKNPDFFVGDGVVLGCLSSERCALIWSEHAPNTPVVCIGHTTENRARTLGLEVLGVAAEPTKEALVGAAVFALKNKIPSERD